MTETTYEESIYNLNDQMSQMGVNDQMSNHGGGESIQGLIQQNDTKSQVS